MEARSKVVVVVGGCNIHLIHHGCAVQSLQSHTMKHIDDEVIDLLLRITQHKGLIAEEVVAWGYYPFRPVLAGSLCAWHDGIISRRKATLALGSIDVAPCLSGGVGPDQLGDCETGTKDVRWIMWNSYHR